MNVISKYKRWMMTIALCTVVIVLTVYHRSRDHLFDTYYTVSELEQDRHSKTKLSVNVTKPHILFIVADDLGFHDTGYHGSDIMTPNIDELALTGVRLENYYVQPICSPTRGQLLTGRYQFSSDLSKSIIEMSGITQYMSRTRTPALFILASSGLSLDNPTIADKLREAGYATHIVGKWHLGFVNNSYLPTKRGFDSFFGYLTGHSDHFTHKTCRNEMCGYDLMENEAVANMTKYNGYYSTFLYRDKVKDIIQNHDLGQPLFIYLPFQSVHSPNQVPDRYIHFDKHINNTDRRIYAGMTTCMDEAIGDIVTAMKEKGMWENTVLVFTTDNGGAVTKGASNWPLRGHKGQLWEGGIRVVGFVHSMLLDQKVTGTVSNALIHVTDWFPTFVRLARGSLNGTKPLDGYDMWKTLCYGLAGQRTEILHDVNPRRTAPGKPLFRHTFSTTRTGAIRVGDWKLITGYPDPRLKPKNFSEDYKNVWLFNILHDPKENKDLSQQFPEKVHDMLDRLKHYQKGMVSCPYPPDDPRANPKYRGGFWGPWK